MCWQIVLTLTVRIFCPELIYDWATSIARPTFCNLWLSPSTESMQAQMWLHHFYIISLTIICLGGIICDINNIGFVSVYMQRVWSFGCKLCNRSLGDSTDSVKQNGRPLVNEWITQRRYTSSDLPLCNATDMFHNLIMLLLCSWLVRPRKSSWRISLTPDRRLSELAPDSTRQLCSTSESTAYWGISMLRQSWITWVAVYALPVWRSSVTPASCRMYTRAYVIKMWRFRWCTKISTTFSKNMKIVNENKNSVSRRYQQRIQY